MPTFRDMTSKGTRVSIEAQMRAFAQWSLGQNMNYKGLAADLCRELERDGIIVEGDHPLHRAADRLVQDLRKQGLIERNGSKWRTTEVGEAVRTHILDRAGQ